MKKLCTIEKIVKLKNAGFYIFNDYKDQEKKYYDIINTMDRKKAKEYFENDITYTIQELEKLINLLKN